MIECKFIEKKDCCGCGVCANVCKFGAITMREDENGFLYPDIDLTKCKDCKACEIHCPIKSHETVKIATHHIENYAAYIKNKDELIKTASGGAATAFAKAVLQRGGVVYGVEYTDSFRKSHTIKVQNLEELTTIRDSKYMQSSKNDIYVDVKRELNTGKDVLFTGTPCEIGALRSYLLKDYENLYTCELICHGPTTYKVAERYLKEQEKIENSKVVNMSVRNKDNGWKIPHIKLEFANGRTSIKKFYESDYGIGFSVMVRDSCYNCKYKGDEKVADVTVGDFWGASEMDEYWNPDGISSVTVHTQQGHKLVDMVENLALFPVDYNQVLKRNQFIQNSLPHNRFRNTFGKSMRRIGLHKTVKIYLMYQSIVNKIKRR